MAAQQGLAASFQGLLAGDQAVTARVLGMAGELAVNLLIAGVILAVTLWLSARMQRWVRSGMERAAQSHALDPTLIRLVAAVVRYTILAVGLIAVLQQLGVKTTSIIAVLGAASLAIGLALQGALGNVAGGVMVMVLRPFRVGDVVTIKGVWGIVKQIDLFSTRLSSFDNELIIIPNGQVFSDVIVNVTAGGTRRFEFEVGIDYDDDMDKALEILQRICAEDERILTDPAPWTKVVALADSSVNVMVRAYTTVDDWQTTRFDTLKRIKEAFDAEGLTIPFPQQTNSPREIPQAEAA